MKHILSLLLCALCAGVAYAGPEQGGSLYLTKIIDPMAVYFTAETFGIRNDGSQDISDALQTAIDQVQETTKFGIVFIPEGKYIISKTIHVWKGIRLIGYGNRRPEFILRKNTPGFSTDTKYLFHFVSDRPAPGSPIQDANAGTFFSGIRNINLRIEDGNPAAIGVRFHVAQNCFLSYMDFHLSEGTIGVEEIGNEIEYCRFYGGRYAIRTGRTSPGWQAIVLDSYLEKQSEAALYTDYSGIMLFRCHFSDMPSVLVMNPNTNEKLWMSDTRFEKIRGTALALSNEKNPETQINLENITCRDVSVFAGFDVSGQQIKAPSKLYVVKNLVHGLHYEGLGRSNGIGTTLDMERLDRMPALVASDIPHVPDNRTWVSIRDLGARGDGLADDTDIIEKAIAAHQTIYFPLGLYRVTRPIVLRAETNIIALHPSSTQLLIRDSTDVFQGLGAPIALLEVPRQGTNIVSGIGINTSGVNPRAVGIKWMAGTQSLLNDVKFTGGHGTYGLYGEPVPSYNDNRTRDGHRNRSWDTQYWSLWVTDGGGGSFKDVWSASSYAANGLYVSDTKTEGRIYYISVEHHVQNEVAFERVANWKIHGLQLEIESGEGPWDLPLRMADCHDVMFASTFIYRVSRAATPFPQAVQTDRCDNIVFRGMHNFSFTKYRYDNSVHDLTSGIYVRSPEFAYLAISGETGIPATPYTAQLVTSGFDFIDGITSDGQGNIYFIDARKNRIYAYNRHENQTRIVTNTPLYPTSLAFDTQGNLIAVCRFTQAAAAFSRGDVRVVSFDPQNPYETMQQLREVTTPNRSSGSKLVYMTTCMKRSSSPEDTGSYFAAVDGKTFIANTEDLGRAFASKSVEWGKPFRRVYYSPSKTFSCKIDQTGRIVSSGAAVIDEGGTDVLQDKTGRIYVVNDNVTVYAADGMLIAEITIPERPSSAVFADEKEEILYITARTSLYTFDMKTIR